MSPDLTRAIDALRRGRVVVYPTDTLYGLGAKATHSTAVRRVEKLKGRPRGMPVSVAFSSTEELEDFVELPRHARTWVRKLLPGPVTLILRTSARGRQRLAPEVTGGGSTLGVRVPAHPVARALAAAVGPLTATSANGHGESPAPTVSAARRRFGAGVEVYVTQGPKPSGHPSRILDATGTEPRPVLRR